MASELISRDTGEVELGRPVAAGSALAGEAGVALGKIYLLPEGGARMLIGRGPHCDVILLDPDLSREHAAVACSSGGVMITDLGSRNGVFVGERRLQAGTAALLGNGDRVRLGACVLRVDDAVGGYVDVLEAPAPAPARAAPDSLPGRQPTPGAIAGPVRAARAPILVAAALMCLAVSALIWLLW